MELCKIQEKDYSYVEALLTEAFPLMKDLHSGG